MTVAATTTRIAYLGNGVATAFTFPYRVMSPADVLAYEAGVQRTDILVTGGTTDAGGTVTFATPPVNGAAVWLIRATPLLQATDLQEYGSLSAETQERAYDRAALWVQEINEALTRIPRLANPGTGAGVVLPAGALPEPDPGKFLRWLDATHLGNADIVPAGAIAVPVAIPQGGHGGTNAQTGRLNLGATPAINAVQDYGLVAGGTGAANQAALNAAIAAINAAASVSGQKVATLYIPAGTYAVNLPLSTITKACAIAGDGLDLTVLNGNGGGVMFNFVTSRPVEIRNMSIANATIGIQIAGSGADTSIQGNNNNMASVIDHVLLSACTTYGISIVSADFYTITRCMLYACASSIHIQNTVAPDAGDCLIEGCTIDNSLTTGTAIYYQPGGGLRISGCKILNHLYGIYLNVPTGIDTSNLLITGNSIENQQSIGILLDRTGTGTFNNVVISGNEFAVGFGPASRAISIPTAGTWLSVVAITGNVFYGYGSGNILMTVAGGTQISITGNTMYTIPGLATPGRCFELGGTNVSAAVIGANTLTGFLEANKITGSVQGITLTLPFPLTFANLSVGAPPANGSVVYCSDGTIANPVAGGGTGCLAKRLNGVWVGN